jgi:hypothetical protein
MRFAISILAVTASFMVAAIPITAVPDNCGGMGGGCPINQRSSLDVYVHRLQMQKFLLMLIVVSI